VKEGEYGETIKYSCVKMKQWGSETSWNYSKGKGNKGERWRSESN
jgi:hypothetical protein